MAKDEEALEYVDWGEGREAVAEPGPRVRGVRELSFGCRFVSVMGKGLVGIAVVIAVVGGLAVWFENTSPARTAENVPASDGGLLADVRGEDRLYRLESSQAALGREMELVRELLSGSHEGVVPSSGEMQLVQSVALMEAKQGMVGGQVAGLEARLLALQGEVERLGTALVLMGERSGELHRLGEGN